MALISGGQTITTANLTDLLDGNESALHSHAIADDSIVEAKFDVSNGPSNDYFLQAQSAQGGGLTWAAAAGGGSLELIGREVASGSPSTLNITSGITSDYEMLLAIGHSFTCTSQYAGYRFRIGDGGGIDEASTDYRYLTAQDSTASGSDAEVISGNINGIGMATRGLPALVSNSNAGLSFMLWFYKGQGNRYNQFMGFQSYTDHTGNHSGGALTGRRDATITITRVQVQPTAGSIPSGYLYLYGVKHA